MNWQGALDLKQAMHNCHTDFLGDWYRDPWGWPEVRWAVEKSPDIVIERASAGGVRRATKINVAKENFSTRPAIVMDPIDRLLYQAIVDRLSPHLIGGLREWALGWRLPHGSLTRGRYASNKILWSWFRSRLIDLSGSYGVGLITDVVSFFANVPFDRLAQAIIAKAGENTVSLRLLDMLEGWGKIPGRAGIPQRSLASAVLANMYLLPMDDVLNQHAPISDSAWTLSPMAAARWMDDIWLFGDDAGELRAAQLATQEVLRQLGLDMNLSKTEVLEGEDLITKARELQHSAVDQDLAMDQPSLVPLQELVESLVETPELANRTSIRFLTTRIRRHELFDHVAALAGTAERMPQGSDHLARLFRDSDAWRDLQDWFIEYCVSPWGSIDWARVSFGTMFPSTGPIGVKLKEYLGKALSGGESSPVSVPFAAQRLAAWDPDLLRGIMRDVAPNSNHPFVRRALALAGLNASEERAFIKSLLGEFPENQVTLLMLEDRNYAPFKVKKDYEGT